MKAKMVILEMKLTVGTAASSLLADRSAGR